MPVDFAPKQRNHFSFHSSAASELECMHYPEGLSVLTLFSESSSEGRLRWRLFWPRKSARGGSPPAAPHKGSLWIGPLKGLRLKAELWERAGVRGHVSLFKVGTIQCFWAPSGPSLREFSASLSMNCVTLLCFMPHALQIPAAIACFANATASPVIGYSLTLPLSISYCGTTEEQEIHEIIQSDLHERSKCI